MAKGYVKVNAEEWLSAGDTDALTFLYNVVNKNADYKDKLAKNAQDDNKPYQVVVAGAGYAGLCAAYCLARCGAQVTLIEASKRYGGRVWSSNYSDAMMADKDYTAGWLQGSLVLSKAVTSKDPAFELGAELIGEFHECYKVLAEEFKLTDNLVRLTEIESEHKGYAAVTYEGDWPNGEVPPSARSIVGEDTYENLLGPSQALFSMQCDDLKDQRANIDKFDTYWAARTPTYTLVGDSVIYSLGNPVGTRPTVSEILQVEYAPAKWAQGSDYGRISENNLLHYVETDNLSPTDKMDGLTLFYTITGAGSCNFWGDDEIYINKIGNSSLVENMIGVLANNPNDCNTQRKMTALEITDTVGKPLKVTYQDLKNNASATLAASFVVMAMPPSCFGDIKTWPTIPAPLLAQFDPGHTRAYKAHFMGAGLPRIVDTVDDGTSVPVRINDNSQVADSFVYASNYMTWNRGSLIGLTKPLWSLFAGEAFAPYAQDLRDLPSRLSAPAGNNSTNSTPLNIFDGQAVLFPLVPDGKKLLVDWQACPSIRSGYSFGGIGAIYGSPYTQKNVIHWDNQFMVQNDLIGAAYALRNATKVDIVMADGSKKKLAPAGVYFAGEHTSPYFLGFMEGALRSGARAAMQIVNSLG